MDTLSAYVLSFMVKEPEWTKSKEKRIIVVASKQLFTIFSLHKTVTRWLDNFRADEASDNS